MLQTYYNIYSEAVKTLVTGKASYISESAEIQLILEDANSPITRKYQEKMFKFVLDKGHIDFGDIPKSAGDIKKYSGYNTMMDTLRTIKALATDSKAGSVVKYVEIVEKAIKNIEGLYATYNKGFVSKTEYVALEYNTYVYFCVEATTALLYSFIDVMKDPQKQLLDIKIKNNTLRADEFYFEQLKKFNSVQDDIGINYRKMLEAMCNQKNNFVGSFDTFIGIGAVVAAAVAIIPVTREIIYQVYNLRGKVSSNIEMQANFLELNKACVNNNELMDADKRKKVLDKQQKLADNLHKLANALRVKSAESIAKTKKEISDENKKISTDDIKNDIANDDFDLL